MQTLTDWLEYVGQQNLQTIDMGLERMQEMVRRMDLRKPARRIVTVAGTNGKGSTCVSLEQILLLDGGAVGTTLSPHIDRFNERIRINGEELNDADICSAFAVVNAARDDLPLTYFEFASLAALYCFQRAGVDTAILEIGLGGRLDAFNALDADVAVITSIGLDHQAYLGDTLAAIGAEKAGILRAGQSVVLGPQMPDTVLAKCAALELTPCRYGIDFTADFVRGKDPGVTWTFSSTDQTTGSVRRVAGLSVRGLAPQNIALALQAALVLGVDIAAIAAQADAAGAFTLPGRMQQMDYHGRVLILDVAHNPAGGAFLASQLQQRGIRPKLIVCGMLADKDHPGACAPLVEQYDQAHWILMSTGGERGMTAIALRDALAHDARFAGHRIFLAEDSAHLERLILSATQVGDVILAFGSFSLVELCQSLVATHFAHQV